MNSTDPKILSFSLIIKSNNNPKIFNVRFNLTLSVIRVYYFKYIVFFILLDSRHFTFVVFKLAIIHCYAKSSNQVFRIEVSII